MSPSEILALAVRRAKTARDIPINPKPIPIQQIEEAVSVPLKVVDKPKPIPFFQRPEPIPQFPTIKSVVEAAASYYGVSPAIVYSNSRQQIPVRVRQVAMVVAAHLTGKSLVQIGRHLGGRDHTTVMHGISKINRLMESDELLRRQVTEIKKLVSGSPPAETSAPAVPPAGATLSEPFGEL